MVRIADLVRRHPARQPDQGGQRPTGDLVEPCAATADEVGGLALGQPMDLAFTTLEVASVALAVGVASSVMQDNESNWLEGTFLLLAYAAIAVAFFFY